VCRGGQSRRSPGADHHPRRAFALIIFCKGRKRSVRLAVYLCPHEQHADPVPRCRLWHADHLLELRHVAVDRDRLLTDDPRARLQPAESLSAGLMAATGEPDVSIAAVLLDTIADSAAAAGVAATGAIILTHGGWYSPDPAVALTIAIVVAWTALALIR